MATSTAQKYEEGKRKEKYDKEYWMLTLKRSLMRVEIGEVLM